MSKKSLPPSIKETAFQCAHGGPFTTQYWYTVHANRLWAHLWTPIWHEGRGPYVSIGLGIIAIYRGY